MCFTAPSLNAAITDDIAQEIVKLSKNLATPFTDDTAKDLLDPSKAKDIIHPLRVASTFFTKVTLLLAQHRLEAPEIQSSLDNLLQFTDTPRHSPIRYLTFNQQDHLDLLSKVSYSVQAAVAGSLLARQDWSFKGIYRGNLSATFDAILSQGENNTNIFSLWTPFLEQSSTGYFIHTHFFMESENSKGEMRQDQMKYTLAKCFEENDSVPDIQTMLDSISCPTD